MKLIIHKYRLQLKHAFTISRRSFDSQETLIIELQEDGLSGYGEATFNPYYPNTSIEIMSQKLETHRTSIESETMDDPFIFWQKMHLLFEDFPFPLCALDVAAHDLFGKKKGLPLHKIWNLNLQDCPPTSYTISIASPAKMIERMQAINWPLYKIKLGTPNDLETMKTLSQHCDAVFRVDANCAWTAEQCIAYSKEFKTLGVEFIEQPLAAENEEGNKLVFQQSVLPIIADESCKTISDIPKCAKQFHGINIKIMKSGGLSPALEMIRLAKQKGLKVMVGCMTESSIGIAAIAQLLPLLDYADMDGALYLKEDIADGVKIEKGIVHFPDRPGTGARLIM